MPRTIQLRAGPITFEVQYYEELINDGTPASKGCLTRDMACHSLWHYYLLTMRAYTRAKANIVYDDELSLVFNRNTAMNIMQSVSNLYGTPISDMVKYWPLMEQQRMQLGGGESLPTEFKFQFSVN